MAGQTASAVYIGGILIVPISASSPNVFTVEQSIDANSTTAFQVKNGSALALTIDTINKIYTIGDNYTVFVPGLYGTHNLQIEGNGGTPTTADQINMAANGNFSNYLLIGDGVSDPNIIQTANVTIDDGHGKTTVKNFQIDTASAPTIGYVWTATDTSGNGSWQAGGGGGGVTGSGVSAYLAIWSGTGSISYDYGLGYDGSYFYVGYAPPNEPTPTTAWHAANDGRLYYYGAIATAGFGQTIEVEYGSNNPYTGSASGLQYHSTMSGNTILIRMTIVADVSALSGTLTFTLTYTDSNGVSRVVPVLVLAGPTTTQNSGATFVYMQQGSSVAQLDAVSTDPSAAWRFSNVFEQMSF